jgi:hypothetical protein
MPFVAPFPTQPKAGRIYGAPGVNIHIDCILSVKRQRTWSRTEESIEQGVALSVHRKRVPEKGVTLEILISDVEPTAGATFLGWESDHAKKTRQRIIDAQGSDQELYIWLGTEFLRTPAGSKVWVIDDISEMQEGPENGTYRATITVGESPRFSTVFTSALSNVSDELVDVTGSPAERGRQSTTTATSDQSSAAAAEVF